MIGQHLNLILCLLPHPSIEFGKSRGDSAPFCTPSFRGTPVGHAPRAVVLEDMPFLDRTAPSKPSWGPAKDRSPKKSRRGTRRDARAELSWGDSCSWIMVDEPNGQRSMHTTWKTSKPMLVHTIKGAHQLRCNRLSQTSFHPPPCRSSPLRASTNLTEGTTLPVAIATRAVLHDKGCRATRT